jgi:CBS domain-containing protein
MAAPDKSEEQPMLVGEACAQPAATVADDEFLRVAAQRMRDKGLGSLVVLTNGHATGIITDRDLVLETLCNRLDPGTARVGEIARRPLVTIHRDCPVGEAAHTARRHRIRRIPVVDDKGELVGMVSTDDLLTFAASELGQLAGAVRSQAGRRRSS